MPNGACFDVKSCLTCADNSSILMMAAVVLTPAQVGALGQLRFKALTIHVVQQDRTQTIAKIGLGLGRDGRAAAKLPTHHVGVGHVPVIITHSPPNICVEDLDTTLAATVAIHHTNDWFACKGINRQVHHCNHLIKSIWPIIA